MPIFVSNGGKSAIKIKYMHFNSDIDINKIGNIGCKYISQGLWPKLKFIKLGILESMLRLQLSVKYWMLIFI